MPPAQDLALRLQIGQEFDCHARLYCQAVRDAFNRAGSPPHQRKERFRRSL